MLLDKQVTNLATATQTTGGFMKNLLILSTLLLASCSEINALSPMISKHTKDNNQNETHPLIGVEVLNQSGNWKYGSVITRHKNSHHTYSAYAGGIIKNCFSRYCLGLTGGAVNGYKRYNNGGFIPFGGFTGEVALTDRIAFHTLITPYTPDDGAMLGFGFKFKLYGGNND